MANFVSPLEKLVAEGNAFDVNDFIAEAQDSIVCSGFNSLSTIWSKVPGMFFVQRLMHCTVL